MNCERCKTTGHLILHAGNLCKKCHTKKPYKPRKKEVSSKTIKSRQTNATKYLQEHCTTLIEGMGMNRREFAKEFKLPVASFCRWMNNQYTMPGQRLFNPRVLEALKLANPEGRYKLTETTRPNSYHRDYARNRNK